MGNCNPFSPPHDTLVEEMKLADDEETKVQESFEIRFDKLIDRLIETNSNEDRKRLIAELIQQSGIPFHATQSCLLQYRFQETQPQILIPFQDFKVELLRNLLLCLGDPEMLNEQEELLPALEAIKDAIPIIEALSRSKSGLKQDLYYIMTHYFTQSVLKISSRGELKNLLRHLKPLAKNIDKSFYYMWPSKNPIIERAVTILKLILRRCRDTLRDGDSLILEPYRLLDIREGSLHQQLSPQEKMAKFEETISHLNELIPDRFLIFNTSIFNNMNGMTLYSERICLSEDIVKNKYVEESVLVAQCLVTILHELAHRKRVVHHSGGYFFQFTPEIIEGHAIENEAGCFVEKQLYGGVINFKNIPDKLCDMIINPENYVGERLNALKRALKNYLYPDKDSIRPQQARFGRRNSDTNDFERCGFHIFKPTLDLEKYFKQHPELSIFPEPNPLG